MSDSNDKNPERDEKKEFSHKGEHFSQDKDLLPDNKLQQLHDQIVREKAEPEELDAPIPIFLLLLCGILLFWGGFYYAKYSGGFRGDVFDPNWQPGAGVVKVAAPFDPLVQGKKLFTRTCQQCHQADGKGIPGIYPILAGSHWLLGSEVRPIKILIKGMSGPADIEGVAYNGNMPPVGDWKDRDIAAVLTYVRQAWGNSASAISEELVAKVREEIKGQTKPWTPAEILAMDPLE